jgi:hypothetical protein
VLCKRRRLAEFQLKQGSNDDLRQGEGSDANRNSANVV